MQNDSPFFPWELIGDSLYDLDGDGQLSGAETLARDADILSEMENAESDFEDWDDASDEDEDDVPLENELMLDLDLNLDAFYFGRNMEQRKAVVLKMRDALETITDQMEAVADETDNDAFELDWNDLREEMERFAETLHDAVDPLREVINGLSEIDDMFF